MTHKLFYPAVLLSLGVGWGATQPLGKMAASTGRLPFGLVFWQLLVCTLVLGSLTVLRRKPLPLYPAALRFYTMIAVLGTLVPSATFYTSIARLPSGIMSILISAVPLLAFPMALAMGADRFSVGRLLGLALGLLGVCLIALPSASLPDSAMVSFLPLAIVGPLFYAMEGIYVARRGIADMDAIQAMFGASLVGLLLCLPIMLWLGQGFMLGWPLARADGALVLSAAMHSVLYTCYVWLAARTGAVYAAQSSYIVTGAGMIWAMFLLGERFSVWVWAAMAVMLAGLSLVQPRVRRTEAAQLVDAIPGKSDPI